MNIFFLDEDPQKAAEYHCDKHVVKMIVESAQLLSTAHRFLDGVEYTELSKNNRRLKRWKLSEPEKEQVLYKGSFLNHPCGVWTRESSSNYEWLYNLFSCLCDEFIHRFNKVHLTDTKLRALLKSLPENIEFKDFTFPALAMPDYCKIDNDYVASYRNYYLKEKTHILEWKKRNKPFWIEG